MSLKSTTTSVWACVVATVTSSAVAYPRSHRRRYTHFTNAVTAAPCTSFSSTLSNVSVLSQHNGRLGFAFPPVSLRCTMRRTCLSSFIQPSPSTQHRQRANAAEKCLGGTPRRFSGRGSRLTVSPFLLSSPHCICQPVFNSWLQARVSSCGCSCSIPLHLSTRVQFTHPPSPTSPGLASPFHLCL